MASRRPLLIAAATMALLVTGALLPVTAWPNNHVVGEMSGWTLGVNYDDWARVNDPIPADDTIQFIFQAGVHNVVQVEEDAYNACDVNNNIELWDSGNDILQLGAPGRYFFICGIGNHCASGMKLAINAAPSE